MTNRERYVEFCRRRDEIIERAKRERWGECRTMRVLERAMEEVGL